jgi:microcystin-dependent protein
MQACKVRPYLQKDGTVYNSSDYPALAQILGSTFGGNGITTFAVPDELSRVRLPWDFTGAANRVTAAGSGINGLQMGAVGGNQLLQSHQHTASAVDSGHTHPQQANTMLNAAGILYAGGGPNTGNATTGGTTQSGFANISVTVGTTGGGGSQNMPPTIVSFLAFIKT